MRVIAGRFRSRKLKTLSGPKVRPTPDRLRETLFNILSPKIAGSIFIDAYAGSGAVGIEALSRGAKHVIFLERNADALRVLQENLRVLNIVSEATVVRGSASVLISKCHADIAFLDPPYEQAKEYAASLLALAHTACYLVIAQHPTLLPLEKFYADLERYRILRQGNNSLSFYQRTTPSETLPG